MTKEELKNLIYEVQSFLSEQDNIEVKAAAKGAPKIYDSLSSLSNRPGGGIIIFGLDEESDFKPVGVYNLEDLMKKWGSCRTNGATRTSHIHFFKA